jgi:cellulose synthase/poly-beta-1,6-N-acetylglucosamine synthase-like glycosyltransferase
MTAAETCFWGCAACVAYAYAGYPVLLSCAARLRPRRVRRAPFGGTVTVVVAAFNEVGRIAARRDELSAMLESSGWVGEVVIVSDGSTDGTAAAARRGAAGSVRVMEVVENVGKAEALTRACASASGDVIVFADARQRWAPDAMRLLLENFADETVGGASGDLCLETAPAGGANAGVGLYWKYEKAIRAREGRVHSTVGVTGAISAVRRHLFRPLPARTILDDVYWPMRVVLQGYRVIHDERARAYDRLPDNRRDEFRRKVRTLSGNFQLVARLPLVLHPVRNPIWAQFLSHKLMRLAVPWLLIGLAGSSAMLLGRGAVYRAAFAAQVVAYLLAAMGVWAGAATRSRLLAGASSFLVLNAAAWVAFWVWICGRSAASWRKVMYSPAPQPGAGPRLDSRAAAARSEARRPRGPAARPTTAAGTRIGP